MCLRLIKSIHLRVKRAKIAENDHVFWTGCYVGAEEVETDDEAFAEKMQTLTEILGEHISKGGDLPSH